MACSVVVSELVLMFVVNVSVVECGMVLSLGVGLCIISLCNMCVMGVVPFV